MTSCRALGCTREAPEEFDFCDEHAGRARSVPESLVRLSGILPGIESASPTCQAAALFLVDRANVLIEKNRAYGDSAANPVRIFSRASPTEQILVRIDDKLSRLARGENTEAVPEDTIGDLIGYLALLHAVQNP